MDRVDPTSIPLPRAPTAQALVLGANLNLQKAVGILGRAVLQPFVVSIDYRSGAVYIAEP